MKTFKLILLIAFIAVGFSSKAQPDVTVSWTDLGYTGFHEVEVYVIDTYIPASYLVASEKNLPYTQTSIFFDDIDISAVGIKEDDHDLRYRYLVIVRRQGTSVYVSEYTGLLDSSDTRFYIGTFNFVF
jgi:hypothetical protein